MCTDFDGTLWLNNRNLLLGLFSPPPPSARGKIFASDRPSSRSDSRTNLIQLIRFVHRTAESARPRPASVHAIVDKWINHKSAGWFVPGSNVTRKRELWKRYRSEKMSRPPYRFAIIRDYFAALLVSLQWEGLRIGRENDPRSLILFRRPTKRTASCSPVLFFEHRINLKLVCNELQNCREEEKSFSVRFQYRPAKCAFFLINYPASLVADVSHIKMTNDRSSYNYFSEMFFTFEIHHANYYKLLYLLINIAISNNDKFSIYFNSTQLKFLTFNLSHTFN